MTEIQSNSQVLGLVLVTVSVVTIATSAHLNRGWWTVPAAAVYMAGACLVAFGNEVVSHD